ncbi:FBP domain-containing protein [Leucobacter allii]|uniref:FBP domain-containing protein n=1 Tax=Leucobacter allii TaxID=2932247 RepID=A0ABY4FL35_9MICO|nr:FBP domain-containing protein [Leucobacter allii]UOQ56975.1 FBP domain-containing protein [Leucobacter allii]UOR01445.1 FBP domain-containing protein [Leucobacter allii]
MHPLTESDIRSSFINASRKEVADLTLPEGFDALREADWRALDYLGWRDPKFARRAYVLLPRPDGAPVGVALRQAEAAPRSRAMCNWCRDVRLPNDVVFWSARRAGPAGRRGGTVGTLVCRDFECSRNVRNDPPPAYEGYDVAAARARRIEELRLKAAGFADMLLTGR